jgi:Bacterial membrane protein YfhO
VTSPALVDTAQEIGKEGLWRSLPRSVGRVPIPALVGLLVSCLIVVVAFSPVLFGGRTLSAAGSGPPGTNGFAPFPEQPRADFSSDYRPDKGASAWQFEPWAEVTHRAYLDGEMPLWNPYQAAGAPLAANMQSAVFDPLLLAVNLHPTPLTWDLSIVGAFVLGAAAAYLFGRVLGLRVVPAVVTSAAFSLSGWFFLYSNNQFSRSYVFLPVLFLLVELVVRSRRLWPVFGLGLAVAGNIYVGMPEASFFVTGAASVYAVVRLVQERATMPMGASLFRLCGGGLLGLMLASPLVLLFLEYESLSVNVHKPGFDKGSEADPVWGLLHWIVPWFPGAPVDPRSWFGVVVGISALVAVSGRKETKRLHAWLFLTLGGFLLAKIYDFGVLGWIGRLPAAKLVVFPAFAAPIVSFAFAVLAGIGVQVLWNRDLRVRRFVTLLALASTLLVAFLLTGDRWHVITEGHARVWGRAAFFALLAVAAVAVAARFGRRWAAVVLAGLIVAELFVLAPFDIYAKRADPFLAPGWMALLRTAQNAEPPSRVFGIDAKLYPNTAGALGLQDIRMLDGLYVERYWRYVRTFIQPDLSDRFTGSDASPARFERNPMFDALSVRAVLSEQDLSNVPALRLLGRDGDTRVYENANAYPRAWVLHKVHLVGSEDESFAFLEARARRRTGAFIVDAFDPRNEAVVEHDVKTTDERLRALRDGRTRCKDEERDRVSIEQYSARSVTLRVQAACAGLLVLPDTYFPDWRATVNGRDRRIYATDGAFRGVTVPKGTSRVEFRYEPPAFTIGIALALAALAGFVGIGLVSWWRGRRATAERTRPQLEGVKR